MPEDASIDEQLRLVTPENLHELFLHAGKGPQRYTNLRAIFRGAGFGFSEPNFNRKLYQTDDKKFTSDDLEVARKFIRDELQVSLQWLADKIRIESNQSNTTIALRKAVDKAIELRGALLDLHGARDPHHLQHLGLQSYYYSFKYSYREAGKILRSAAAILSASHSRRTPRASATVLIERHYNRKEPALEDTAGLLFDDNNGKLWVEAIETTMLQPRKFVLTGLKVGHDRRPLPASTGGVTDEHIQVMTGFQLGGYAKHPSSDHRRNGVFASPFVLQRVPATKLQQVLGQYKDEEFYTFRTADQVLTELSNAQDYLTEQELKADETIYDEVLPHLEYYRLWDSNRPAENLAGERE